MFAAIVSIAAVVISAAISLALSFIYLREDKGRHGENMNVINHQPLVSDDTEQMSSFDRAAYIETQERMARTDEHIMFLANEEWWAEELRSIMIDAAHIQADLNSGRLAFPEWIWSTYEPATASAVQ